jgi:hypothetical protein
MIVLIFLVGSLFGLLVGALLCIRFVRQEITGELGPKLRQIQGQLNTIEAELTYVVSARYAELNSQLLQDPRRPKL